MICLLAATPYETKRIRQRLSLTPDPAYPGRCFRGHSASSEILLCHIGIGCPSAALHTTRLLERITPEFILLFGCGGSYPAAGLKNGDLAIASAEIFGDLGAATVDGFLPLSDLGLPPAEDHMPMFIQQLALDNPWQQAALAALGDAEQFRSLTLREGPFVSVQQASGTMELCNALAERNAGLCENMEGAAVAQVAQEYGVPLVELRGISNPCGTRDPARWDLKVGMTIAQEAVIFLLEDVPRLRSEQCA